MIRKAGVEEAGRGPVIGPMVMCIAVVDEAKEEQLRAIGVKDSKLLSPKQRTELVPKIKRICADYRIKIISPKEIDEAVLSDAMNLNFLEAKTSAELINKVLVDKVILDCPSNNIPSYTNYVKGLIQKKVEIVGEHKADVNHLIVGAASIIAKVARDEEIEKIKQQIDVDFGSGYPSDPLTAEFIKNNWNKYPEIIRRSWESVRRLENGKKQTKLETY